MKVEKKRHRKKSYSNRNKRIRIRTSSGNSNDDDDDDGDNDDDDDDTIDSSTRNRCNHSSTSSNSPVSSSLRSTCPKKKKARNDSLPALEFSSDEKPKSIASYIKNREEMARHMFASLQRRELYELLPEKMKNLELPKLLSLCIDELNRMSKKRICSILEGKDFTESSESEGEINLASTTTTTSSNSTAKKLKAEIAVADSTTEATTSCSTNLSDIHPTVETNDVGPRNSRMNSPEVHCIIVESTTSSIRTLQGSEIVVQPDSHVEKIRTSSLRMHKHADIFVNEDSLSADDQTNDMMTSVDEVDDLEEGEVVSDQDQPSSNSAKNTTSCENHSHNRCSGSHGLVASDKGCRYPVSTRTKKNSENVGSLTSTTNKLQEEKRLNMLELELRARAIEALMKRSENKS